MEIINTDIIIIGAGGAGLRAAIAIAEKDPATKIALLSKVYPMRSHTVAAEGGAAAVISDQDNFQHHFDDTVAGSDWLCDQDVVDYFVKEAPREMTQMEHWGCPWSRTTEGNVAVRPFGGMKIERTWYASDKTGFHLLHTLFQTSLKYHNIQRFDEFYSLELITEDNKCHGVLSLEISTGKLFLFIGKAVIMATGGAGRVFPFTTNGSIKTGDGIAMAYRAGLPLKDMEFIQYHPTGLPGTGILITEGARGEGGILVNKDGYRYLQDYNLGPPEPWPRKKAMELGPRDRLSQAFWHEQQKGNTIPSKYGDVVHLDIRHLGKKKIESRLPMVRELAKFYAGVDPIAELIPVRPVVHYVMGGIHADIRTKTPMPGLFAIGECSCLSLNGANRLGSNSLAELLVFGKVAGEEALEFVAKNQASPSETSLIKQARTIEKDLLQTFYNTTGTETVSVLKKSLNDTMETGVGIYRNEDKLKQTCTEIAKIKERFKNIAIKDKTKIFNTELILSLELKAMLDVGEAMAHAALARQESRGAHQRLDFTARDDENYLKHTLLYASKDGAPEIKYTDVKITKSAPKERVYGGT